MYSALVESFTQDYDFTTPSLKSCKVYVVNLDRRSDRWNDVQKILNKAGFNNLERVSAIDGKKIDTLQVQKLITPRAYRDLGKERKADEDLGSLGAIGCYLSHYKIWMKIIELGEPAVIAEDDMILDANMDNFECIKNSNLLKKHDMVLLGYSALRERPKQSITQTGLYDYDGMFFGTHFYYLTPQGAEKLLSESLPIDCQVDSYMGFMLKKQKLTCAFHYPNLSWQNGSATDIQTPLKGELTDIMIIGNVPSKLVHILIWAGICILIFIAFSLIFNQK